jgi:hypothetical protein
VAPTAAAPRSRACQPRIAPRACAWRAKEPRAPLNPPPKPVPPAPVPAQQPSNPKLPTPNSYASETLLVELLLASPHRTLDPEEADFFFVPVLSACYLNPVLGEGPAR